MKRIVVGMLAHVDAGKTTLSEALLYDTGKVRTLGGVDTKDSHLDTFSMEKERGITVFSKQAVIDYGDTSITLLDTPGHVDFSSEMERTLQVLDYAVLIISARDGVQAHTETLWSLLKRYSIPTFVFINKMDMDSVDKTEILSSLKKNLASTCIDFSESDTNYFEEIACSDEAAFSEYESSATVSDGTIKALIADRKIFPCLFGSALKNFGTDELLEAVSRFSSEQESGSDLSARIFKISRDTSGNRMTFMKILGGSLKVRSSVKYCLRNSLEERTEKVSSIRIYTSGDRYEAVDEAPAGSVCAVLGLSDTFPGQGIGTAESSFEPVLTPVLAYRLILPENVKEPEFYPIIKQVEDEFPEIDVSYNRELGDIYVHLMGEMQSDSLKKLVSEKFGIDIGFSDSRIEYRETIAGPVEGIGHFEPLRHYAEVHLLMEPGEPGSGIVVSSVCKEDILDRNWQNLVLTHILEKQHRGVLTGSPVTDMKITLVAGKSHAKHTEGGDFRQATYRAVRQGLMKADSVLLEPYYSFTLRVPSDMIGRAVNDIKSMSGTISAPSVEGTFAVIRGNAPVSEIEHYGLDLAAYTKGKGSISLVPDGYAPCHNAEIIIKQIGYNPESDLENTPDSVFCSHGTGTTVKWSDVEKFMHVSSGIDLSTGAIPVLADIKTVRRNICIDDMELEKIMEREFGPIRRRQYSQDAHINISESSAVQPKRDYLIVDGYNVIFSWDGLSRYAKENLEGSRHMLMDLLSNYRGYTNSEIVLVFDGYKVKDNVGEKLDYHGIKVVFTKENETGDMYIEKLVSDVGKNYRVRVVTSDNLIQISVFRNGVLRMSSSEFREEIEAVEKQIDETIRTYCKNMSYRPFENSDNEQ